MDVSSMRRIDRWIGVPACIVLTLVRRLGDLFGGKAANPPRKVAVIKLAEQGATVLAYPALARLREKFGEDNVYFVVFSQNRFILDVLGVVRPDRVVSIQASGAVGTAIETLKAVWRMRREKIDATLDFEFFARSSAILSYLSGARTRVGFHAFHGEASWRGDLMTHRLSSNPFLHASEIFQLQVSALDLPAEKLPTCDLDLPPIVLLNANCSDLLPLRRWEPERYVELSRRLLEEFPRLAIAFTGAPDEAADADRLVQQIGSARCVNMAGRTTMNQLLALYDLSELMVTNDSGPAHYSTLTDIDVITIFGPETPAVFGARTPRSHILWSGLPCSPCVNAFNDRQSACKDNVCMQRISVDQVFDLTCDVLRARLEASS
jgi:ADP-heptose:LPS heptosyltransferase